MAQKKVISALTYARHKREIDALYTMGYRYDMEKNPEKKEKLKVEIIKRCNKLKPKLGLKDVSDEEAQEMLGVSFESDSDVNEAVESGVSADSGLVESGESGENAGSVSEEIGSEKG